MRTYRAFRSRQDNEDLYWSNEDGWVDLQSATLFTALETETTHPPLLSVAMDIVSKDNGKLRVMKTFTEYPPSAVQKHALLERLRLCGIKSYQEQVSVCAAVLEDVGIQCLDEDTLEILVTAVASNINDGTLDCDCLANEAETR